MRSQSHFDSRPNYAVALDAFLDCVVDSCLTKTLKKKHIASYLCGPSTVLTKGNLWTTTTMYRTVGSFQSATPFVHAREALQELWPCHGNTIRGSRRDATDASLHSGFFGVRHWVLFTPIFRSSSGAHQLCKTIYIYHSGQTLSRLGFRYFGSIYTVIRPQIHVSVEQSRENAVFRSQLESIFSRRVYSTAQALNTSVYTQLVGFASSAVPQKLLFSLGWQRLSKNDYF